MKHRQAYIMAPVFNQGDSCMWNKSSKYKIYRTRQHKNITSSWI